jgi:alkylated DNA nucleotide flippase Atl1
MGKALRKSWQEKLADSKDLPRVVEINEGMSRRWGTGTCVIPAPMEVDTLMRKVPKGKVTTINEIRAALARRHGATIGCPITTGIFAGIAARAAEEAVAEGRRRITPYWRTLRSGGELNPKYPGGVEAQAARLKDEGHAIELGRDKQPKRVKDFEKYVVKL